MAAGCGNALEILVLALDRDDRGSSLGPLRHCFSNVPQCLSHVQKFSPSYLTAHVLRVVRNVCQYYDGTESAYRAGSHTTYLVPFTLRYPGIVGLYPSIGCGAARWTVAALT